MSSTDTPFNGLACLGIPIHMCVSSQYFCLLRGFQVKIFIDPFRCLCFKSVWPYKLRGSGRSLFRDKYFRVSGSRSVVQSEYNIIRVTNEDVEVGFAGTP